MGERSDLYSMAAQNGIEVLCFPMPNCKSMSAEVEGRCYIGLDDSRPMTAAEESACVGHELGHCLYGGFYTRTTPFDTVERHEARADKWYIQNAIPCGTLFSLLRRGYDAWEIAEQLDTTEEYVRRAYYFYMDNGAPNPRCD